jgi:hypothetical protein
MKNISMKVFRCKLADDVMPCGTALAIGRKDATGIRETDADLLSWCTNYFTRFGGETEMLCVQVRAS